LVYTQSDEELAEKYQFGGPNGETFDARSGQQQIDSAASQRKRDKDFALDMLGMRVSAGLISDEEADEIRKRIERIYDEELFNEIGSSLDSTTKMFYDLGTTIAEIGNMSWDNLVDSLKNIGDIAQTTFAVMGSSLETYSQFASAQTEIDINRTEKQYSRKIELAQGNSYKVSKLEKEKEEKIEKLQKEGTRREYTIKTATAIADTAQNAVKAYGAGLEAGFPMALWLAPMLAGIATATGLAQVALIKKQQTAAESGYAEGGFTKKGGKYEPAGIVHAGEWVASQELLASPVARPLIDALDYAQRTNTIGSLDADDVSRSITASDSLVRLAQQDSSSALTVAALSQNSAAVTALVSKLSEPFVTVNTVSGDKGIKKAQDEYEQLVRNKTPKSRRK
jgi:hypothetical protein